MLSVAICLGLHSLVGSGQGWRKHLNISMTYNWKAVDFQVVVFGTLGEERVELISRPMAFMMMVVLVTMIGALGAMEVLGYIPLRCSCMPWRCSTECRTGKQYQIEPIRVYVWLVFGG